MSSNEVQLPRAVDFTQLQRLSDGTVRWLWEGYVAFGSITLFTSRWKSGKTTLLSVLLSRMSTGGTLAGSAVASAPVIVVSEESPGVWVARGRKLSFGANVRWICQPFLCKPSRAEWEALVGMLASMIGD